MCVCLCVCVPACVRACVFVYMCVYVRACVCDTAAGTLDNGGPGVVARPFVVLVVASIAERERRRVVAAADRHGAAAESSSQAMRTTRRPGGRERRGDWTQTHEGHGDALEESVPFLGHLCDLIDVQDVNAPDGALRRNLPRRLTAVCARNTSWHRQGGPRNASRIASAGPYG